MTTALDGAFATLASAVRAERDAAVAVAEELVGVRRLLDAAAHDRLPHVVGDLELAAARLEAAGRRREQARRDLCAALALEDRPCTLAVLAARAPAPWAERIAEDRSALHDLSDRITREAAAERCRAEREQGALHQLIGEGRLPGAEGPATPASPGERRLVADLGMAPLVTELRLREVTYETLIAVTKGLAPRRLSVLTGHEDRST